MISFMEFITCLHLTLKQNSRTMKSHHIIIAALCVTAFTISVLSESIESTTHSVSPVLSGNGKSPETTKTVLITDDHPASNTKAKEKTSGTEPAKCVFRTAFEGEGLDQSFYLKIPGKVLSSIDRGLDWLDDAQQNDGGWGAGSHSRQDIRDPHAVQSDPATTAMVAMALHRAGSDLHQGKHSRQIRKALNYLLDVVEEADANATNITTITNTQPQIKLGRNIDVVLTSQFLTNILPETEDDPQFRQRVKRAMRKCVGMIEDGQQANGAQSGSGWAGVLQSSFATSALESAKDAGIEVDEEMLDKSREYQKQNINPSTNDVVTESAAGIVLYSVSGSARATAAETAEAKETIRKAKKEGLVKNEEVTVENLKKAGMSEPKAMKYATSYKINQSAKRLAQDDNVMTGFGNNGGEEFLSYLQTGEGLIMSKDMDWHKWYDKMSGRMLDIQNNDGSWSGHHCITSPVFCTATCLLILSVNNDIDRLTNNQ